MKKSYKIKMILMLYSIAIFYVENKSSTTLLIYILGFSLLQFAILVIELSVDFSKKRVPGYLFGMFYVTANFLTVWDVNGMLSYVAYICLPISALIVIMDLFGNNTHVEEVNNEKTI